MDSLVWLVSCLEQGRTAIAPTLADAGQRRRIEQLKHVGALAETRARAVICPRCEAHSVRVLAVGKAVCSECGPVTLQPEHMQRLTPDGNWLRRRMAQALGLAAGPPWPVVSGQVWRLGDIGHASARRRILYGERLARPEILRALHTVWPSLVGEVPTILLTTTSPERVFLPGLPVSIVPIGAAFRQRGTGLIAIGPVWEGLLQAAPQDADDAPQWPFVHDFRHVLLPGESEPIPLTPTQSALLKILWAMTGKPLAGQDLLHRAGAAVAKPVDAFPKRKYPEANRAYHALVSSDRQGRYWMPRTNACEI